MKICKYCLNEDSQQCTDCELSMCMDCIIDMHEVSCEHHFEDFRR